MTETHATTPVFPPGRYGRRRDGKRHVLVPAILVTALIVASALLMVKLYRQYGDPTYDAQVIRYTGITDTQVTVDFHVTVPPGGSATCLLRARAYDGTDVGRRTVTVRASGTDRQITASEQVPTTAKAFIGEVLRCGPAG